MNYSKWEPNPPDDRPNPSNPDPDKRDPMPGYPDPTMPPPEPQRDPSPDPRRPDQHVTPRPSAIDDGKNAALQTEITQDAISRAERIMRQIDARWPGDKVPGKS